MPKRPSVAEILQAALRRKKHSNPAYSMRALARDLGVSAAFASKMMAGQKLPPKERLEKLSFLLELDVLEKEAVVAAVMLDPFAEKVLGSKRKSGTRQTTDAPTKEVLGHWANLAVLEGLTLESPHCDPTNLAVRLGLGPAEMRRVLQGLAAAGLVAERDGQWHKNEKHLYVAGGRSRAEVRAFHAMMIEKAKEELRKAEQADFERRLINGFTFAVNTDHLERLKAHIIEFLNELAREAAEGVCTEVYQCNVQLFPLTKPADNQ